MTLSILLHFPHHPPSVNHAYISNGRGGKIRNPEVVEWQEGLAIEVAAEARRKGWNIPRRARWAVDVTFSFPRRQGDVDNLLKLMIDGIRDGLGVDDVYLDSLIVTRITGPRGTRLLISLIDEGE